MRSNVDKYKPMGDQKILDKKIKTNEKYKNIETKLQTGTTIRDVELKSDKYLAKRKGENFQRIRVQTLSELFKEEKDFESIYDLVIQDQDAVTEFSDIQSVQSSVYSVTQMSNVFQNLTVTSKDQELGQQQKEHPYLLLDIRQEDCFSAWKIKDSTNFPIQHLKADKSIPEFYRFKNKENKLIILYGLDEKEGIYAASLFFEKGYDNIYLLTGGIEKFAMRYPKFIEGQVPQSILDEMKKNPVKEKQKVLQRQNKLGKEVNFDCVKSKELNLQNFSRKINKENVSTQQ